MFKVKNVSGGSLPLGLEKGSTILSKNASLDLDGLCSRKWIRSNKELQHLLNPNVNALVLIHDSETGVPPQPIKDVRKNPPKSKPKEKPVIVDFSDVGDVEQDEPIVEDLSEPEEPEEVEDPIEEDLDAEMEIEEPEWEDEAKEELEDGMLPCPVCGKPCKGERGLRSHMRSHKED